MEQQNQQTKSNLTKPVYQSTFLPLVEHTNNEIKTLVVFYMLNNLSLYELQMKITSLIQDLDKRMPLEIKDRQEYINALYNNANNMINQFYKPFIRWFTLYVTAMAIYKIVNRNKIDTPKKLINYINKQKPNKKQDIINKVNSIVKPGKRIITPSNELKDIQPLDMWSQAKGTPYIENYGKLVKQKINGMAKTDIAPTTPGKRPITIWQKAELDIRHDNQMEMLNNLRQDGNVLCWISSHPDCSKRCEKWQGKLVDIVHHAELSGFRMKNKVDGHTVYSLVDIMAQKDKYGYENNIINGFNCRHHLEPYTKGSYPPTQYNAKDIKKEREINAKLRAMERNIRELKQKANLYAMIDKEEAKKLYAEAKKREAIYKKFANSNGFAWYQYRIQA